VVKMLADSQEAFAKQSSRIRAELLAGTILGSDETSARVGKRNWWTWVFHHGDACCFVTHRNRSKVVVSEFLGDYRPDYWISDRYGAQRGWAKRDHQFCLAHLIRDAKYAIDAGDTIFAPRLRDLLKRACGIAGRRPNLADSTLREAYPVGSGPSICSRRGAGDRPARLRGLSRLMMSQYPVG